MIESTTLQRASSINEILNMNYKTIPFSGEFFEAFSQPEAVGVWFIAGGSTNGKSSFVMQLARELCLLGMTGIYNSLEEAKSLTLRENIERCNMADVGNRLKFVCESMEDISARLLKKRSVDYVIIDSFQYAQISYKQYIAFKQKHPNKLLIFISHAEGKVPVGRAARSVQFDASLKIWIEGFRAISKGRFIGKKGYYTIWQDGADKYWGCESAND